MSGVRFTLNELRSTKAGKAFVDSGGLKPAEQQPAPQAETPTATVVAEFVAKKTSDEIKLNGTERQYLSYLQMCGYQVGVQNVTLKLAFNCRFTPDFNYVDPATKRWVFVDVKGFQREDALIKIKAAARLFPHLDFMLVKKVKKGWNEKKVKL